MNKMNVFVVLALANSFLLDLFELLQQLFLFIWSAHLVCQRVQDIVFLWNVLGQQIDVATGIIYDGLFYSIISFRISLRCVSETSNIGSTLIVFHTHYASRSPLPRNAELYSGKQSILFLSMVATVSEIPYEINSLRKDFRRHFLAPFQSFRGNIEYVKHTFNDPVVFFQAFRGRSPM